MVTFALNSEIMQRALLYTLAGTALSFLLNWLFLSSQGWELDLYYGFAFGLAWGTAYLLDDLKFTLPQKLGYSLLAMAALLGLGALIFSLELAVPSVIKFSMVFVVYYLLASFRPSKSMRR